MTKRTIIILFVALGILFQGANLWADDDAIMDVDDNAASFFGPTPWINSTFRILFYGDDYEAIRGAGIGFPATHSAVFTTAQTADISGFYHVYVRWTAAVARATSAVYTIRDDLNAFKGSCVKDQRFNGGAWQFCDEVFLNAGRRGRVVLANENEPNTRFIIADAVRFVRQSWDSNNLVGVNVAEIDWVTKSSRNLTAITTLFPAQNYTNLTFDSLTAPSGGTGYVVVRASGWARLTASDERVEICIDDASGGTTCDSWVHILENNLDEVNSANFENRKEFSIQEVYSISGGTTKSFYLKARRESSAATGDIFWDDFVLTFIPRFD